MNLVVSILCHTVKIEKFHTISLRHGQLMEIVQNVFIGRPGGRIAWPCMSKCDRWETWSAYIMSQLQHTYSTFRQSKSSTLQDGEYSVLLETNSHTTLHPSPLYKSLKVCIFWISVDQPHTNKHHLHSNLYSQHTNDTKCTWMAHKGWLSWCILQDIVVDVIDPWLLYHDDTWLGSLQTYPSLFVLPIIGTW